MKDLMLRYGVTLGRRYTPQEKALFRQEITERFETLGYQATTIGDGKGSGMAHVIAGNPAKAKVIVLAAYDTPPHAARPGFRYFPLHKDKNLREEKIELALRLALLVLLGVAAVLLFRFSIASGGALRVVGICGTALLLGLCLLTFKPFGNRVNFNRNSAALAAMVEAATHLTAKDKAAFAFVDHQVASFEGVKNLCTGHEWKQKPVLVLDCLAHGERLVLAHRECDTEQAARLAACLSPLALTSKAYAEDTMAQNITGVFPKGLLLASGRAKGGEFVVEKSGTKEDVQLDLPRLVAIAGAISNYIEKS